MGHSFLPPPLQMSNGGSPPAPLPHEQAMPASRRLLPFANTFAFASSARASPRDNSRPNLLPNKNRRPPKPSSYGSAAAASLTGWITGLCDARNAMPLLHACAMSRTAAGMRQLPKSDVATKRPPNVLLRRLHGLMHWQDLRSRLVPVHELASALVGAVYIIIVPFGTLYEFNPDVGGPTL